MTTIPAETLWKIFAAIGGVILFGIILVLFAMFIACCFCLKKRRKGEPVPKESTGDCESGRDLQLSNTNQSAGSPESRPMLEPNVQETSITVATGKVKDSASKRTPKHRSDSQRELLVKQNSGLSPEETQYTDRSSSFKSATQTPDPTGVFGRASTGYETPQSMLIETESKETRRSTVSGPQNRISGDEIIYRCNTAPTPSPLIPIPSPNPVMYPFITAAAKPNSPLLDRSLPIGSSGPIVMELEGNNFQFLNPISLKEIGESYNNINVMKSLNSQSNTPPTYKRKSQSDSIEVSSSNDSKKPHLESPPEEPTESVSLIERLNSVQDTNNSINTAECDLNPKYSRASNESSIYTNIQTHETDTMAPNTESLYRDILNSNTTTPDVISYVTHLSEPLLDGPPPNLSNRDFIVNSISGTIHSFIPDSLTSSMATPNSNPSLALSGHACSEPVVENSIINPSMHSDVSVALLCVTSPETQDSIKTETDQESSVSFSEINVNEGLGPHHMYRQVELSSINSKTRPETDFKSIQSDFKAPGKFLRARRKGNGNNTVNSITPPSRPPTPRPSPSIGHVSGPP